MSALNGRTDDAAQEVRLRHHVKAHLRKQAKAIRRQLPSSAHETRSKAIRCRLEELAVYHDAQSVAAFVSIRSEVRTAALLESLIHAGKRLALPRIDFDTGRLELHWAMSLEGLITNRYDIPEPPVEWPSVEPADLEVILVPGLAVDERGHRIGYGAGYYDRLVRAYADATRIFVGYDFQRVAEVPNTSEDEPMDWVVTDERAYECPARS